VLEKEFKLNLTFIETLLGAAESKCAATIPQAYSGTVLDEHDLLRVIKTEQRNLVYTSEGCVPLQIWITTFQQKMKKTWGNILPV
jgi:hypothetical protein